MSERVSNALLILISGPSGGGKTTLCEQILAANENAVRATTCTTRPPRDGERDGIDYYFLTEDLFSRRIQSGDFLEHAIVYGNRYGTLREEITGKLRLGKDVLLSVDVQGAASLRDQSTKFSELDRALVTVFIAPPSLAVLKERLERRGKDSPASVERRLNDARREMERWTHFEYLIPSRSISESAQMLQTIMVAEKMRVSRSRPPVLD